MFIHNVFTSRRAAAPKAPIPLKTKRLGTLNSGPIVRPVADARNKIIQRNRSKITDARDKLAQITKQSGDVRQKLMRKQQQLQQQHGGGRKGAGTAGLVSASSAARNAAVLPAATRRGAGRRGAAAAVAMPSAHHHHHRLADDDADDDIDMDIDFVPATYALRRTVQNDIAYSKMPPLPQFSRATERARSGPALPSGGYHPAPQHHQQPLLQHHHHHHAPQSQSAHHHRLMRPSPPPPNVVSVGHHHGHHGGWSSGVADPFDCYEVPMQRPIDVSEPKNLQRQIRGAHPDLIPTKGILRYSSRDPRISPPPPPMMKSLHHQHHRGGYAGGYEEHGGTPAHLSYEMRTRLERAPDSGVSAGTFSNPYTLHNNPNKPKLQQSSSHHRDPREQVQLQQQQQPQASSGGGSGYRIVVSNLHSSVSQSDIRELFEDIGELVDARLVRPGVAEVIFRTMKDAEMAVDTYHNRQLDGQPMKCLLVNPRPVASRPTAPALKSSGRR